MNQFQGDSIPRSELQSLCEEDGAAKAMLEFFKTRTRRSSTTTVDQMESLKGGNGRPLSRSQIIEVLRKLEGLGLGSFTSGRRGHKSRFEWDTKVHLGEIGRKAVGDREVEIDLPPHEEPVAVLLKHSYRLRPNLSIGFDLPSDLTHWEATRLSDYIKTLAFERPGAAPSVAEVGNTTATEQR